MRKTTSGVHSRFSCFCNNHPISLFEVRPTWYECTVWFGCIHTNLPKPKSVVALCPPYLKKAYGKGCWFHPTQVTGGQVGVVVSCLAFHLWDPGSNPHRMWIRFFCPYIIAWAILWNFAKTETSSLSSLFSFGSNKCVESISRVKSIVSLWISSTELWESTKYTLLYTHRRVGKTQIIINRC